MYRSVIDMGNRIRDLRFFDLKSQTVLPSAVVSNHTRLKCNLDQHFYDVEYRSPNLDGLFRQIVISRKIFEDFLESGTCKT